MVHPSGHNDCLGDGVAIGSLRRIRSCAGERTTPHLIRDTQPQPIYILDLATGNSIGTLLFCFLGRPFTQFISLIWSSGVFRNSVEYVQGRKIEASLGKRNHWTVERVISNLTERIEIACEG
jgi:hypothetical protein